MRLDCPPGWHLVRLSDVGEVNRGRSRHRPRHASHLYGGQYPFIQTGDVKASGGRITKYQQTYSAAGLQQSRLWPAGTMCITIAANIAETGILAFDACFPDCRKSGLGRRRGYPLRPPTPPYVPFGIRRFK
ncbi:MAG: restriction endonuclease subunit S [Candidatus Hodarchaeota archaeon]